MQDVEKIYGLQMEVLSGLEDRDILRYNTKETFEQCIKSPNLTIGLVDKSELIALIILVDARGTKEDLSVGLEKHQVVRAANFKLVMVKEGYRGNGFQRKLMWILEKYANLQGYTHLCTTVSGENAYSFRNMKELKYEFDHDALKYGGLQRKVLVKNIEDSVGTYNKKIISKLEDLRNYENVQMLTGKDVDLRNYFQGEFSIATTGDILEYKERNTENRIYGVLVRDRASHIYRYHKETNSYQYMNFQEENDALILQNVWIYTINEM